MAYRQERSDSSLPGVLTSVLDTWAPPFFVEGTVDTCPDLSIESGSGESIVVSAPYQRDVVQHLYSMAEQSQVGTLERTVIDTSARRSKEFSQVKVTDADRPWPLEQVCEEIRAKLAPGATRVHADLYKLLLYNKGDFFNMHKDAQQHSHMFASLLFFLPFEHEGGGLQLSRLQTSWEKSAMFDVANINKDGCCSWVAFYTDVCHKVLDVKSGHRLVLNYTLRFEGSMSPSPCLPKLPTRAIDLVKQTLKGNADLAIPLFYAYTAESFGTSFLKGRDAYLFNALHACGLAASVRFVLCIDTTSVWYYDDCPEEPDWHTSFDRAVLVGEEFVREAVQLEEERHQSRGFDNDGRQLIAKGAAFAKKIMDASKRPLQWVMLPQEPFVENRLWVGHSIEAFGWLGNITPAAELYYIQAALLVSEG